MSKEKNLIKNTFIYLIGNFSSKFLSFLLLPLYTYYLSTVDYGTTDLINTTVSFFIPIVSFQLMDGAYRYLIGTNEREEQISIISNSFIIVFRNLMIIDIIFIIINIFVDIRFSVLIFLQFNVSILTAFFQQCARGLKKNFIYSVAGVIATIVMLTSNIVLIVVLGLRAEGLIISTILAQFAVFIFLIRKIKLIYLIKFNRKNKSTQKKLVKYSLPLIPNYLNWWIMNVSDRFVINLFLGVSFNGIYAVANKFPHIVNMFCSIFNMAWQESAILEYDSDERDAFYSGIFDKYFTILLTTIILMLSGTRILFSIIINSKFSMAYSIIPFLYFGVMFSTFSSFYGTGYQSSQHTKGAFVSSILGSIVNIVVNVALVPHIGLQAASVSTMLAFAVMWGYRVIDTRKYFKIKIKISKFMFLSITAVIYTMLYYNKNIIVMFISIIIAMGIFIVFNREYLGKILDKVIKKHKKVDSKQ